MSPVEVIAFILVSGFGGIASALALLNREAVIFQALLTVLAIAIVLLLAGTSFVGLAIALAVVSWSVHVVATLALLKR